MSTFRVNDAIYEDDDELFLYIKYSQNHIFHTLLFLSVSFALLTMELNLFVRPYLFDLVTVL